MNIWNIRGVGRVAVFLLITSSAFLPINGGGIAKQNQEVVTHLSENEKTIATLNNLIQLDINSYNAYAQAIQALATSQYVLILRAIQAEHAQQIQILSEIVLEIGGVPPIFLLSN